MESDQRQVSLLQVADEQRKKERHEAQRSRRKRRRMNWLRHSIDSVPFKVALFLVFLVLTSMAGITAFEMTKNSQFETIWDTFWYAIVTVTTVGYGDKTPITVGGRIVGLLLMGMGVVVVAAITGQIASFLVDQQMKRREGLLSLRNIQNHFIICGWRKELDKVVEGVLAVNADLDPSGIVLINSIGAEKMQGILNNPVFKGINYINGDYIEEETLKRANIKDARRVMLLADQSQEYSLQEMDSRTVMAVLTIESISKRVYVCAELLDEKFEKYLRLANCDEIILSREYSKLILANASSASGVSHIVTDLLSTKGGGLKTKSIPADFIGKSFGDLSAYLEGKYGAIIIGLLENTGNFYHRKKEALNEAQMTPDISTLVENLKAVKQLTPNKSVLNPGKEYIVKKNSRAIVIELATAERGAI
ncbi:potassium channel protein [Sediminispirochaeta bajacaliforniensis]|uniref:potassium channel protein n=1 Tax=Sediminispirochaeta bajacaliforniensis TaxID=148 RepID=UPI0003815B77|nr:potassium channel family protein [Sediminispirochaeta bajacaliforniensis]